ncbi:unnamed protein product [Miscanthus lutarioriparius]|uniref:Uncharacterized protein n=1 Tax=Miscanthus lutarioriparius TaxID=422564 RepID=A0A811RKN2_9POAL|nr:unnamed protein product [Miscanthus lutarioriparius]
MGGAGPRTSTWRAVAAAAVALWLVPAVLALAVLWLPLLCCAVAAVRFLRVRRKLVVAARRSSRGCWDGDEGGDRGTEEITMVDATGGGRLRLLQQYLDDQMELLVGGGAGHEEQEEGGASASC